MDPVCQLRQDGVQWNEVKQSSGHKHAFVCPFYLKYDIIVGDQNAKYYSEVMNPPSAERVDHYTT